MSSRAPSSSHRALSSRFPWRISGPRRPGARSLAENACRAVARDRTPADSYCVEGVWRHHRGRHRSGSQAGNQADDAAVQDAEAGHYPAVFLVARFLSSNHRRSVPYRPWDWHSHTIERVPDHVERPQVLVAKRQVACAAWQRDPAQQLAGGRYTAMPPDVR